MLIVAETHPVQYHAPVYRAIEQGHDIQVLAVYGSDFSVAGYRDQEFGAKFAWDVDLLSGYRSEFLSRVQDGGAGSYEEVTGRGLISALKGRDAGAFLLIGYSPRFFQLAAFAALRSGAPVLFRAETTDHALTRSGMKQRLRDFLLRRLYGRMSRLLYVGKRSRDHFLRLGCDPGLLSFSPYCVDTTVFSLAPSDRTPMREAAREEMSIPADSFVVLFSGKLSPRKAPGDVLQAVRALPRTLRERAVVVFLGAGELTDELRRASGVEPAVEVRFTGFQNQRRLSGYYHAADVLVMPSRWSETWGLVVNEAMHHGLPCVVSDAIGCAPDLIESGRTGEVYETGNTSAFAMALERVAAYAGTGACREACLERVNRYSVAEAARGIAEAYHDVRERTDAKR